MHKPFYFKTSTHNTCVSSDVFIVYSYVAATQKERGVVSTRALTGSSVAVMKFARMQRRYGARFTAAARKSARGDECV